MIMIPSLVAPAGTDWPEERSTDATVPEIGAVSVAATRFGWASTRLASSESIAAWSLANCSGVSVLTAGDALLDEVAWPPVVLRLYEAPPAAGVFAWDDVPVDEASLLSA